jgi:hypothetical protein
MSTRNILDDIFSMDEKDSDTFMDAVRESYVNEDGDELQFDKTEVYGAKVPELKTQTSGFIKIMSGPIVDSSGDLCDYVWHIAPSHHKKTWKVRPEHLLMAIQKVFLTVVPQTTRVWIWAPDPQWEIPEWSFKAMGLLQEWSVDMKDIEEMNIKLLEVCNSLL